MEISREELEEIVDKKVEERLKQQETARSGSEAQGKTGQKEPDSSLSRRNFLKALGGGAAGLGAAAMIPSAAGFQINSNKGLSYYNSSSANKSQFEVGPNGILDAQQIGTDKNPVDSIHSKTTNTGELSVTDEFNTVKQLVNPTDAEIQTAVDNLNRQEKVQIYGDFTVDSTITITTKSIGIEHVQGTATLNTDGFKVTESYARLNLNRVDGQDYTTSPRRCVVIEETGGTQLWFDAPVLNCESLIYCHGTANAGVFGVFVHRIAHASKFQTAVDLFADGGNIEGVILGKGRIFNTDTTILTRGTAKAQHNEVRSTTLHGFTAARNNFEVDEQADGNNFWSPLNATPEDKYSLNDRTWLNEKNTIGNGLYLERIGSSAHLLRIFDSDGNGQPLLSQGDSGQIRQNTIPTSASGSSSGRYEVLAEPYQIKNQSGNLLFNVLPGGNIVAPNGNLISQSGGIETAKGTITQQRGQDPSTNELDAGENMTYNSDGSSGVTGNAGDLIYAVNHGGTIKTSVIAAVSNAT